MAKTKAVLEAELRNVKQDKAALDKRYRRLDEKHSKALDDLARLGHGIAKFAPSLDELQAFVGDVCKRHGLTLIDVPAGDSHRSEPDGPLWDTSELHHATLRWIHGENIQEFKIIVEDRPDDTGFAITDLDRGGRNWLGTHYRDYESWEKCIPETEKHYIVQMLDAARNQINEKLTELYSELSDNVGDPAYDDETTVYEAREWTEVRHLLEAAVAGEHETRTPTDIRLREE
jgi:hypothetical protein